MAVFLINWKRKHRQKISNIHNGRARKLRYIKFKQIFLVLVSWDYAFKGDSITSLRLANWYSNDVPQVFPLLDCIFTTLYESFYVSILSRQAAAVLHQAVIAKFKLT